MRAYTTGFVASILLLASGAAFAQSVNLTAGPAHASLSDGQMVPMWGYSCDAVQPDQSGVTGPALCAASNPNAGSSWSPVVITVPYNSSGTSLTINLTNNLKFSTNPPTNTTFNYVPTSLVIVGQLGGGLGGAPTRTDSPAHPAQGVTWFVAGPPDPSIDCNSSSPAEAAAAGTNCPPHQGRRVQSFATEVAAAGSPLPLADGQVASGSALTWNNLKPGTYLIHSGTHPSIQSTMGLYGVLVVTTAPVPAGANPFVPGNAYPTSSSGVAYDADAPVLLSEIDPVQNGAAATAVATAGFSETKVWNGQAGECGDPNAGAGITNTCYPPAVNYDPRYYLINGVSFDRTNPLPSNPTIPAIPPTASTGKVLLRFVNAGLRMHVPSVVGRNMSLIAEDGNVLPGTPKVQSQVFLAAGKAYDVTIQPTQSSPATYAPATYPIFDRQLSLSTNNLRDGGMQAYLKVAGGAAPAPTTLNASNKTYYCVAGVTLDVTDPSKGVLAGATGANGAVLVIPTTLAGGDTSLLFQSNGTFTYTPPSSDCGGSFTYLVNGTLSKTATITRCDAISHPTGCPYSVTPPTANNDIYTSNIASRLQISPPGVLLNDTDPSGLPLKVDLASVTKTGANAASLTLSFNPNGDGSFTASVTAPGTYTFTYSAKNSQNTLSSAPATVMMTFPTPTNLTVAVKDAKTGLPVADYRWIIEEDRTFYIDPRCQVNSTNPALRPADCPPLPIPTLGTNFHTSYMPVVASGCVVPATGGKSCELGQSLGGTAAACDVGNGACRTGVDQRTPVDPSQVYLDPAKRYYISILPGDAGNTTIGGAGGAMQVNPNCDPTAGDCAMRQFDLAKDCKNAQGVSAYTYPPTGAWEVGGPDALCGHAMGGAPIPAGQTRPQINISLQQTPLQTANITVFVFQDDWPLNGEHDAGGGVDVLAPQEPGLGGFELKILDQAGGFGDSTGQATYDMFNMPLSNGLAGMIDPVTGLDACPITERKDGLVGMIPTCPTFESDGTTLSPLAGQALIANLYPGLYEIAATPAADRIARGEEWLQTNTLDGTKPVEAFVKPGEPRYFQEFGPGGFHVAIGFANPKIINARKGPLCANQGHCNSTINGTVTNARMSRTPDQRVYDSLSYDSYSFTNCYVSLGDPNGADFAFTKCDVNGNFTFAGIPAGNWRVTVFDQWNDLLVDGLSTAVQVDGVKTVNIPVTQWRANLYTRTFLDVGTGLPGSTGYGDGVSNVDVTGNPIEPGLPLVATNIRYRDGSYAFFNNTDLNGFAGFNEVFPFLNWLVVETDTTRYKQTGAHVVYDSGGPVDGTTGGGSSTIAAGLANTLESPTAHVPPSLRVPGAVYCDNADCTGFTIRDAGTGLPSPSAANPSTGRIDPPWATTQAWQGLLGQNSFIEWGMKPFVPGENGGIKGHVLYASTRPFDDPALYLQLSWLPAVPNVTINLYQVGTAPDGTRSLKLADTTQSSSWDAWAQGFRSDGVSNMNCPGQETDSPFYFTLLDSKQWLNPTTPIPGGAAGQNSRFKCYDGWSMLNQVQPAPYDGMYKFPSIIGRDPVTGAPAGTGSLNGASGSLPGTNCTICVANPDDGTPMLPAGKYVVEMILPPGYELVKEEDKNLLLGDVYIAPITQQFAGLGNIFIMPDQAAINAWYNKNNPGGLIKTTNFGLPRHEGDTGSVETFWPCVGATRVVPDWMSLFVGATQNAPFAGASRPLCDRKEVTLADQMTALAKFYVFSSTHVAGHFTGTITNDFASEFDPFSPQFGEKFAPPNLPVSFKDFAGNEVSRVYADQWGIFNGLYFSTWGVNPPNPTGYVPQMAVACMNDPGPIPDPAHPGQTMTDPQFNPAFSNFCYETPFMPGQTQYMDTPVVATQAFAEGYNPPDCEYPDTTPAIKSVHGPSNGGAGGPWVSNTGQTLTITALGDKTVLNPAYSGPRASNAPFNQKYITRHYGFGSRPSACPSAGNCPNVTVAGVPLINVAWSDLTITGMVPAVPPSASTCTIPQRGVTGGQAANYRCGQLEITAANGKKSIDTVTVTIAGKPPTYVNGENSNGNALQTAIDNATPGDLIIVGPGKYKEMLLMWKPVRLQGVGPNSVTIDADAHPAGRLDPWRRQVNCLFGLALNGQPISGSNPYDATGTYSCSAAMRQKIDRIPLEGILGWDTTTNGNLAEMLQEPTLMGAYEGSGITVLGKGVRIPADSTDFWGIGAEAAFPIGYRYLTGSTADCTAASNPQPGRDYATSNFNCNPSRIDGFSITNSSQGGGGIYLHGWNHRMEVANTRIYANHGTLAGGINVGSGEFPDPFICDAGVLDGTLPLPFSGCTPAQLNQQLGYGLNTNVRLHHNAVTNNASIGDALFSGTPSAAGGVTLYPGSDNYQFKNNWVCGNLSSGDGGGVMHAGFNTNGNISNNWLLFNQSANPTIPTHGGGLAVTGTAPDRTLPNGEECGSVTDLDCPPGLSEGAGPGLVIDANLIMGNSAESGSGGGIRMQLVNGSEVGAFPLLPARWYDVTLTNNIIANNVAGWDGGGVSMQDALKVNFINNTVISNDTTGSAGVLFNTLGAPNASVPPPGCNPQPDPSLPQDPSCTGPAPNSTNQPVGLVTMQNTPNLIASLPAIVICPIGHSSGLGASLPIPNGDCRRVSYPLLRNDMFWQNRAFHIDVSTGFGPGQQNQQHLVTLVPSLNQTATGQCVPTGTDNGAPGSAGPVNYWDIGVRGDTGPTNHSSNVTLEPRFSILTSFSGSYGGNGNIAPSSAGVVSQYCNGSRLPPENGGHGYSVPPGRSETTGLSTVFTMNSITPAATVDEGNNWINLGYGPLALNNSALYTAANTALALLGDYSITSTSPAFNAASSTQAPNHDFFGRSRPLLGGFDIGAVEFVGQSVPAMSVAGGPLAFGNVTVGVTSAAQTLTLNNTGTGSVTGISLAFSTWFERAASPGTCPTTATFTLTQGSSCTINVVFRPTQVGAVTDGTLTIHDSVVVTGSPVSLTGTGVATPAKPTLAVLDNFNRANANTLGANWSQVVLLGSASIRVNANQALDAVTTGAAYWNGAGNVFGANQAAAFTFPTAPLSGSDLVLKASGGMAAFPANYIRVRYTGSSVVVETTTNLGISFTTQGTFAASFVSGDTLTALVDASGTAYLWKTTAANVTTFIGGAGLGAAWTGAGRIGMQLPVNARVDDFAGGTVPSQLASPVSLSTR